MKITCHSCSAKYTVSDEKVQGKTVKMKCRKCGATIVVGGAGGTAPEAAHVEETAAPGEAPLPVGSYLVNVADNDQRTMSTPEIMDALRDGVINGDTYVWTDGMADWQAIADHPDLSRGLGGGAPAPQPSAPYAAAATPFASPSGNGGTHAPLAAAASDSARPAARKETTRRGNDLFGGGGGSSLSSGGMSGGLAAQPMPGKRDENSVLFSLSALTQAAPASTRGSTTATKDDSGLIDLKALAATATPAPTAVSAAPMLESPALFPLGAAPAPVAHTSVAPMAAYPEPKKSNMLIPLIVGGVVALGAIVGVFFMVQGSGPPPQPSVVYVDRPAPPPTETVAAAPPEPTAAPTADPTASATATAVAAAPKGGWKGGTRPNTPATAKTSGGTGPTPPATAKPGIKPSKCGCAPGDLACAMKCSAK